MTSRSMQNYIMPYAMIALFDEKLLKVVTLKVITIYMCKYITNNIFIMIMENILIG